jgi:DNA-binding LytR/AlgR family response regulator
MSTRLNCLIVEDEPLAQNVLKNYIPAHPALQLVAICNDAVEAQVVLHEQEIDLIFLDINLPMLSGINFLKTLSSKPMVIFTTAYPEFAVEGFELDAVDYLLKPFSLERFLKAVNKALQAKRTVQPMEEKGDEFISLKADKKVFRVFIPDIMHLEAMGDYVRVTTINNFYLVNDSLRELLSQLPLQQFIRVHKSYAVARNKISFLEGNYIRVGDKDIPIGATYRDEVFALLK